MALVINANKTGETDGSMANMLGRINCHTPLVIVSRTENFVFNEELFGLDKYVLVDASEHGWDFGWLYGTPLFGKNFQYHKEHFKGEGYEKFNQFVTDRRPLLYFKRELLKRDAAEYYQPIEYAAWHQAPLQSEEEFNRRPLEVFFNWGLSNPMRPMLHGDIWWYSNEYGYVVCDSFFALQKFLSEESNPKKWVTVNTPHYVRQPVETVLQINGLSKISVCLWGAGRKCFRTTGESPLNAVMILPEDGMAYQHAWVSGFNCIKMGISGQIESIVEAANRKDLYEIYKNGHATCEKYMVTNYCNHLANIINKL